MELTGEHMHKKFKINFGLTPAWLIRKKILALNVKIYEYLYKPFRLDLDEVSAKQLNKNIMSNSTSTEDCL